MITIPVRVCGDVWCDPNDFTNTLQRSDITDELLIDLRCEGPSLGALGILACLEKHCLDSGRDPATIRLINAPNSHERTVFKNDHDGVSHFFAMSIKYWLPWGRPCDLANRFGFFVGRNTVARCVMMYELSNSDLHRHFKFSTMDYQGKPIWDPYPGWRVIEKFDDWLSRDQQLCLFDWWNTSRPSSIDNKKVQDQYIDGENTNLSLLHHYAYFQIELVAETYTLGDSFFPTEKTVRPIMAAKPFLLYGPVDFLTRLKNLGFKTYSDLWDESYDQFEGPQRWDSMKKVIRYLGDLPPEEFRILMSKATEIAIDNRRVLADMVLTDKTYALKAVTII